MAEFRTEVDDDDLSPHLTDGISRPDSTKLEWLGHFKAKNHTLF